MSSSTHDGSVVVGVVRRAVDRLQSATGSSVIWSVIPGTQYMLANSKASGSEPSNSWLKTVCERSRLWNNGSALKSRLTTAGATARTVSVTTSIQQAVFGSFSYRWLTAEPDSEVIVIDLRETWTAGPIINSIDRILRELAAGAPTSAITDIMNRIATFGRRRPITLGSLLVLSAVASSLLGGALLGAVSVQAVVFLLGLAVLAVLGLRSTMTLAELRETRVVSLLIAAFEPPEPPSSTHSEINSSRQETSETETDPSVTDEQ